jgi:hypothetical protein
MKSLRGNLVEQIGAHLIEHVAGAKRLYNPKRDRRRQLMQQLGLRGGRQWKKLRRALRAQGGEV